MPEIKNAVVIWVLKTLHRQNFHECVHNWFISRKVRMAGFRYLDMALAEMILLATFVHFNLWSHCTATGLPNADTDSNSLSGRPLSSTG